MKALMEDLLQVLHKSAICWGSREPAASTKTVCFYKVCIFYFYRKPLTKMLERGFQSSFIYEQQTLTADPEDRSPC